MRLRTVGLTAISIWLGCSPSGTALLDSGPTSDRPRFVSVDTGPGDFGTVVVSWQPPLRPVTAFGLTIVPAGVSPAGAVEHQLGPTDTWVLVSFTPALVEAAKLDFYLRAEHADGGDGTAMAEFQFGLIAPFVQLRQLPEGQDLFWSSQSVLAQQVQIERALRDGGLDSDPQGPWSKLALLPTSAVEYVDTSAQEDVYYAYRLQNLAGSLRSDAFLVLAQPLPIKPPTDLRVQPHVAAATLTWTNNSAAVVSLGLSRASGPSAVRIELNPTATQYEDSVPPGCYTYQLLAAGRNPNTQSASNQALMVTNSAGGDFQIDNQLLFLPEADYIVPDGFGGWALLARNSAYPDSEYVVVPSPDAGWSPSPALSGTGVSLFSPALAADADGLPHAVFLRDAAGGKDIVHTWFDGQAWQTEVVATRPWTVQGFGLQLTADASRQLHLLWATDRTETSLEYAVRTSAGWTVEPLISYVSPAQGMSDFGLAVDPAGMAHVVYGPGSTGTAWHLQRTSGSWSREAVPINFWGYGYLGVAAFSGGGMVVVFDQMPSDYVSRETRAIARVAGQWGPVQAPFQPPSSSTPWPRFPVAPTAVGAAVVVERMLYLFDGTAWQSADFGGCNAQGAARVLYEAADGTVHYVEQSIRADSPQFWYTIHSVPTSH